MVSVSPMRRARALGAAAATLSLLVLSGCSALDELTGPADAPRDEPGGEITASAEADVFSIAKGDCIDMDALQASMDVPEGEAAELDVVPVVPCTEPHTGEVFAETQLPEGDFPGEEAIDASVTEFCEPEFATFVGLSYAESTYDYFSFFPTVDGWEQADDRTIQCIVVSAEPVTATLAGTAK